jgi:hypothetical protein
MALSRLLPVVLAASLVSLHGATARADEGSSQPKNPWVDQPLTLKELHFSGDAGLGFGTYQDGAGNGHVGWGSSFDAAIGLPFLGELGGHIAQRFGNDGVLVGTNAIGPTGADHFARLYDPITQEPGSGQFANPEFHLRGTLVPLDVFELGLETRLTVPTTNDSWWAVTPGIPIRIHAPGLLRIDTGLWLPVVLTPNQAVYILEIPAQLFVQVGDAFVGPLTGVRINNIGGNPTSTDVPVGVGGGYTFAGILDVKAQLRTERINSGGWASQAFGGGLGVGIRVP